MFTGAVSCLAWEMTQICIPPVQELSSILPDEVGTRFDVTRAVRNWRNGAPNYGLLIQATNEYIPGRNFRFASNADPNKARNGYIQVTYRRSSSFTPLPLRKGKDGPDGQVPAQLKQRYTTASQS